jgi:hypothetical protein
MRLPQQSWRWLKFSEPKFRESRKHMAVLSRKKEQQALKNSRNGRKG